MSKRLGGIVGCNDKTSLFPKCWLSKYVGISQMTTYYFCSVVVPVECNTLMLTFPCGRSSLFFSASHDNAGGGGVVCIDLAP